MRNKVVYQNFWMWKHGIRPLPLWLVGWFVIPLENFRAWRQRNVMVTFRFDRE